MSTELRDAVIAHLAGQDPVAPWYWYACDGQPAPIFRRHDDGTVTHVSGHPPAMTVSVDTLKTAVEDGITWDGAVLGFPGGLRYRPVAHDEIGQRILCERTDDSGRGLCPPDEATPQ